MTVKHINPQTKTLYLVHLPNEFEIQPFQITKIKLPTVKIKKFHFIPWLKNEKFSNFEIELFSLIDDNFSKKLFELIGKKSFDIKVELLDPSGIIIQNFFLNGTLKSFTFDELEYGNDNFLKTKLIFKTNEFKV